MDAELSRQLQPLVQAIARQLAQKPEHFITHPTEARLFRRLSPQELRDLAHRHGWRVVRRLGGRRIEFYNDAHERLARARTGNIRPEDERFNL